MRHDCLVNRIMEEKIQGKRGKVRRTSDMVTDRKGGRSSQNMKEQTQDRIDVWRITQN